MNKMFREASDIPITITAFRPIFPIKRATNIELSREASASNIEKIPIIFNKIPLSIVVWTFCN